MAPGAVPPFLVLVLSILASRVLLITDGLLAFWFFLCQTRRADLVVVLARVLFRLAFAVLGFHSKRWYWRLMALDHARIHNLTRAASLKGNIKFCRPPRETKKTEKEGNKKKNEEEKKKKKKFFDDFKRFTQTNHYTRAYLGLLGGPSSFNEQTGLLASDVVRQQILHIWHSNSFFFFFFVPECCERLAGDSSFRDSLCSVLAVTFGIPFSGGILRCVEIVDIRWAFLASTVVDFILSF